MWWLLSCVVAWAMSHLRKFCREYALFGFVLCRLLCRHLGFDSDFAQISGQKIGGWELCWVPISPKIVSHSLSPETNQIPVLQHLVIKYHTCLSHKPSPPAAQPPRSLPQLMWHFLSFGQGVLGTRGTSSQGESCGLDGAYRYCRPSLHQPAGE